LLLKNQFLIFFIRKIYKLLKIKNMKKLLSLFAVLFLANCVISQTKYETLNFKGNIDGKYPITMVLNFPTSGNEITGSYYYDKVGTYISLKGSIQTNRQIELEEGVYKDEYKITGYFSGKIDEKVFSGTWKDAKKTKSLSFVVTENYTESVKLKSFYISDSIFINNDKNMPSLKMSYHIEYPTSAPSSAIFKTLKTEYQKNYFGDCNNNDFEKCLKNRVDSIKIDYINIAKEFSNEELLESPYMMTWDFENSTKAVYNDKNFLILETSAYEYTGGAHGMYWLDYSTFDLKTGKIFTKDEVFLKSKENILLAKIKQQIIDDNRQEDVFDIEEIYVSENILFGVKTVTFFYMPYEIGPYAAGIFEIQFDYSEIKDLLTPNFKTRMNIQ
jgi:hypothetical protein